MYNIFRTRVEVVQTPPQAADAEGLAMAANDHLWMGSGLSGELKRAGGEEIEIEAVRLGPAELGQALATAAGKLPFKRLYHLVVMGQDLHVKPEWIAPALRNALAQAGRDGLVSLAIAPLESPDMASAFRTSCREIARALLPALEETSLRRVVLAAGKPEALEVYRDALREALRGGAGA